MEEMQPIRGISRDEYLAAVRVCPSHPAFAGTYEDWIRATLSEIEKARVGAKVPQLQKRESPLVASRSCVISASGTIEPVAQSTCFWSSILGK